MRWLAAGGGGWGELGMGVYMMGCADAGADDVDQQTRAACAATAGARSHLCCRFVRSREQLRLTGLREENDM